MKYTLRFSALLVAVVLESFIGSVDAQPKKATESGVSISANTEEFTAKGKVAFIAKSNKMGIGLKYVWQKNGTVVGDNTAIYNDNNVTEQDIISCAIVDNATGNAIQESNEIVLGLHIQASPSLMITSASGNKVYEGNSVVFKAMPTNGGTAPQYQWMKNGVTIYASGESYTDNDLNDGDVIACMLVSNDPEVTEPIVMSNSVTMTVVSGPALHMNKEIKEVRYTLKH
ncbi:MAG: hypothetical protein WCG87_04090 [Bacteroidota bacterium]